MNILPTGQQFHINSGPYTAVVTEVGATLRSLTRDGAEVLWTFAEDEAPRAAMGHQMLPWPNRIRDGRYTFDGVDHQLPISEVPRNNAIHGLASQHAWRLVSHAPDEIILSTVIYPQPGWSGTLVIELSHALDDGGLTVTVTARNAGSTPLPYGYGSHPYLALNAASAQLTAPFPTELEVDHRLLPVALRDVTAEHDFRTPRGVPGGALDATLRTDGPWEVSLLDGSRSVALWADATLPWCQLYIPPSRDAIAVEPMTCGGNVFNPGPTQDSLIILPPGEETTSRWGLRVDELD